MKKEASKKLKISVAQKLILKRLDDYLKKHDIISWLNSPESREKHRRKYTDMEWARHQQTGAPRYKRGDAVEFQVGGFGIISEVHKPSGGWPSSYATENIPGMRPIKTGKCAWHYEGDFKRRVAKSPLPNFYKKINAQ